MNRVSGDDFQELFHRKPNAAGARRTAVNLCEEDRLDLQKIVSVLELDEATLQTRLLSSFIISFGAADDIARPVYRELRFCRICIRLGFHCAITQSQLVDYCPFHFQSYLRTKCTVCHAPTSYWLSDFTAENAFRCLNGHPLGGSDLKVDPHRHEYRPHDIRRIDRELRKQRAKMHFRFERRAGVRVRQAPDRMVIQVGDPDWHEAHVAAWADRGSSPLDAGVRFCESVTLSDIAPLDPVVDMRPVIDVEARRVMRRALIEVVSGIPPLLRTLGLRELRLFEGDRAHLAQG